MVPREHPAYRAIFVLVLAPIAAAVVVGILLLFGAEPRAVFFVGHALKSGLSRAGVHAPNAVGVLSTLAFWWAVVVAIGFGWERRRHRAIRR